ncbi:MAG: oligosaccharide flippase family protein [bacterium]
MKSEPERIKRTVAIAYFYTLTGQGCNMLFYFFLYKYLPVEDVGLFSLALAVATFFGFFIDLGIYQILIRFYAEYPEDLNTPIVASLIIRLPIFMLGLVILLIWNIASNPSKEIVLIIFIACLIQVSLLVKKFYQSWLRGNSRQNKANLIDALEGLGWLIVAIVVIVIMQVAGVGLILSYLLLVHIAILLVAIYFTTRERRKILYIKGSAQERGKETIRSTIRILLKPGLIFGALGFFTLLQNRLDWVLVSQIVSNSELANYSMANKVYEIVMLLIGIATTTAYPWLLSKGRPEGFRIRVELFMSLIISFGITLALLASLYAPGFLSGLFGDKYKEANIMVTMIMFGATFAVISQVLFYLIISQYFEKYILPVIILASASQLAIDLLLIPSFSGMGAIIGMIYLILIVNIGLTRIAIAKTLMPLKKLKRIYSFLCIMLTIWALLIYIGIPAIGGLVIMLSISIIATNYVLLSNEEKETVKEIYIEAISNRRRK